jgi:hypothetical protein
MQLNCFNALESLRLKKIFESRMKYEALYIKKNEENVVCLNNSKSDDSHNEKSPGQKFNSLVKTKFINLS